MTNPMGTPRKRSAPRAPKADAASIRKGSEADKARKAASKKALRATLKPGPLDVDPDVFHVEQPSPDRTSDNLAAVRAEAEATGMTLEQAAESMGVDLNTGAPLPEASKPHYSGPMLALVKARKNYKTAKNGNPCCGDGLAQLCGQFSRETVVRALVIALKLESNPYAHLNPGQQSMNLRNRARKALKDGFITTNDITFAFQSIKPPQE